MRKSPKKRDKWCIVCNSIFSTVSSKAKTCSQKCNYKNWRQKNPDKYRAQQIRAEQKRKGKRRYSPETRKRWWARLAKSKKLEIQDKANARAKELRTWLGQLKTERGCADCGYKKHPAALDFDHVRGKKNILISFSKSKAQALRELRKCEIRCSNCHRIKSWERRWSCKPDIFEKTYEAVE